MKNSSWYSKLFVVDRFFTIAIQKRQNVGVMNSKQFSAEYIVPANRHKWVADPMIVDADDKTYLFYEAVIEDKGHIEVAEVLDDCSLSESTVILKDSCHYSYPFVFRYKDEWYMIPESSSAVEVRLYRASVFPTKWEMCSVLLNERAVDTTVFEKDGQLYLLTFLLKEGSERVVPHAYKLKLSGECVELKEIPWSRYDELRVRGAGPFFKHNEKWYRPAQISREQYYGDGLVFYQAEIVDSYDENLVSGLLASDLNISEYYVDGLHTYCGTGKFEVIDIRCGVIDYLKPVKKMLSMLKG